MSLVGSADYPGSWGDASKEWPYIRFPDEATAKEAYHLCIKKEVVPYGSYVLVGKDLRLETMQQVAAMHKVLKAVKQSKGKRK